MPSSNFSLIDLRETVGGRVAYVKGTRLAVYWLVSAVKRLRGNIDKAAEIWELPPDNIRAALAYAEAFPQEMKAVQEQAEANQTLLEKAEAALEKTRSRAKGRV